MNIKDKFKAWRKYRKACKLQPRRDITCGECHFEIVGDLQVCWRCGSKHPGQKGLPTPATGTFWRVSEKRWIEVCHVCHGNCGQCGTSRAQDIPADFRAVTKTMRESNGIVGLTIHRIQKIIGKD